MSKTAIIALSLWWIIILCTVVYKVESRANKNFNEMAELAWTSIGQTEAMIEKFDSLQAKYDSLLLTTKK